MLHYGGNNLERLFLKDKLFISEYANNLISVKKTDIPGIDMEDLIARHKARYGIVALFCKPGLKVLDFPCGSGYASKLLSKYKIIYIGAEVDKYIVEYANLEYRQGKYGYFIQDDLTNIKLKEKFDIIACIEGIEHIGRNDQYKTLNKFYDLLNSNGVLIISMPEAKEKSGPNPNNKFHLYERTKKDFEILLSNFKNVQILEQENKLSTGKVQNCLYGICRKEK